MCFDSILKPLKKGNQLGQGGNTVRPFEYLNFTVSMTVEAKFKAQSCKRGNLCTMEQ